VHSLSILLSNARCLQSYAAKDVLSCSVSYRDVEYTFNSNPRGISSSADSNVGIDGTGRFDGLQVSDI
jgi:hypothetical protein